MKLKELYHNLKGKSVSKEEIQQFVNRREDYKRLPARDVRQIVTGASLARYGVWPDAFSLYTFNAGEIAADLEADFYITRALLARCLNVERVILFYSFYNRGYDLSKSNNKRLCCLQTRFLSVPARKVPKSLAWGIALKCLRYRLKPTRPAHPKGEDFPNAFTPAPDIAQLVDKHIKQATKYGQGPWQWLLRLQELCAGKKTELVICFPPVREDYRNAFAEKIDLPSTLLPFNSLRLPVIYARAWIEPDLFGDECHLTPAGAAAFSRRLEETLSARDWSNKKEISAHL